MACYRFVSIRLVMSSRILSYVPHIYSFPLNVTSLKKHLPMLLQHEELAVQFLIWLDICTSLVKANMGHVISRIRKWRACSIGRFEKYYPDIWRMKAYTNYILDV